MEGGREGEGEGEGEGEREGGEREGGGGGVLVNLPVHAHSILLPLLHSHSLHHNILPINLCAHGDGE